MNWINTENETPNCAGRYLVVVEGPYFEHVDIRYFNGGLFKVDQNEKVTQWKVLPDINSSAQNTKKLFKISTCDYDGYKPTNKKVIGLFSTRERAENYITNTLGLRLLDWGYTYEIEELEVID